MLLVCSVSWAVQAQSLKGRVMDADTKEALPFVSIRIQPDNTTAYTDENGNFEISSTANQAITLSFSLIGYKNIEIKDITPRSTLLEVVLQPSELELKEAMIEVKKENVGKTIMRKAIAQKEEQEQNNNAYSCDTYLQTNMEKWIKKAKKDTTEVIEGYQPVYLYESFSRLYYLDGKYKQHIKAERKETGDEDLKNYGRMAIDWSFSGSSTGLVYNPIEYFRNPIDAQIDLYENQINQTTISDRPITSPLSNLATLSYNFKLIDIEDLAGDTIFTIQVEPKFKESPLFEGIVKIKQNGYLLKYAKLTLPNNTAIKNFSLEIRYDSIGDNLWRPSYRKFNYNAPLNGTDYKAETLLLTSNFDTKPVFENGFFNNELIVYELDALNRDTTLLSKVRPLPLTSQQQRFVGKQDSLWLYQQSPEYYRIQDSIYNHNTILDFLYKGVGWKRRSIGLTLYFNSMLESIQPLGVGGYRQSIGGSLDKEFASANNLELSYQINYGFANEDWKGRMRLRYTYLPRRFSKFSVSFGDTYEMITLNQSLEAIFSRSNFVRSTSFGAGHSFEVWNGIYLTTDVAYADKRSIEGLQLERWSSELFGELNTPATFDRYVSLILDVEFLFQFQQKYITRGRKKIVLGTNYPVLRVLYRKGIPNIGTSEVNFDQIELNAYHKIPPTKLGTTNWNVKAGSFLNTKSLRLLEYRFFRGSDIYLFSDPLNNLQLLGPTLSTANPYLFGAIIHHFDGVVMDKIPLLNKLQLETIVGGAALLIPDQSFEHLEAFVGLGKKFRLLGEQLQIAIYAVSANNDIDKFNVTYKLGLNFFDALSGRWIY